MPQHSHAQSPRKGKIYLVGNTLGGTVAYALPQAVQLIVGAARHFIVENAKNARKLIKAINDSVVFSELTIWELSDTGLLSDAAMAALPAVLNDQDVVVLSDAGMPCVADPGASVVRWAHEQGVGVVPCVGPSAIVLALAGSGLNGQSFRFHGYLPIKVTERTNALISLERDMIRYGITQIFIETPYRNQSLYMDILLSCQRSTLLCVASNLTCPDERIITRSIAHWQQSQSTVPKIPTIFLLGQ